MADETQPQDVKKVSQKQMAIRCGVLLPIVIVISVVIAACAGGEPIDTSESYPEELAYYKPATIPDPTPVSYPVVVYEITGSASYASATLSNREGGTEQYSRVAIPWRYTDKSFFGSFLYISAQNQGEYGTVTVSIYVDDKLYKTSTSSGAYVIATASGSR